MPLTAFQQVVANLPNLLGFWDVGATGQANLAGSLGALINTGAAAPTLGQPSIIPGDPAAASALQAAGGTRELGHVPDATGMHVNQFTIGVWAQPAELKTVQAFFVKDSQALTAHPLNPTAFGGVVRQSNSVDLVANSPGDMIVPGNVTGVPIPNLYHFLCLSYDQVAARVWLNGVQIASLAGSLAPLWSTNPLRFGASEFGGPVNGFKGYGQAPFFCASALAASDIRAVYMAGASSPAEQAGAAVLVYPWPRQVLAANPSRRRLVLQNDGDATMYAGLGASNAIARGGVRLQSAGGQFESRVYTGAVSAVVAAVFGPQPLLITEE